MFSTKVGGFILMSFATAPLLMAIFLFNSRRNILADPQSTFGRVVRIESVSSLRSNTYIPIVEFQPETMKFPVTFRNSIGRNFSASYKIGDSVKVLYSKADPARAMIDDGNSKFLPLVLVLVSVGILVLAIRMIKLS